MTLPGPSPGLAGAAVDLLVGAMVALAAVLLVRPPPRRRLRRLVGDGARRSAGSRVSGRRGGDARAGRVPDVGPVPAAVLLDLVAEVLAGGAPVSRAVAAVGEALRAVGDPQGGELLALAARLASGAAPPANGAAAGRLAGALDLALATGSSPVGLLRAAAQEERRDGAARAVQAARRLGVLVLLPTGLCLLPAFLLLTVVPMAIGLALG